ncbi:M20/M25/M40 family metallo-hydrolase [Phaeobacter gallaeciensis]|uniref:Glutamate carboxypeptidase n=1 Tax=Phaeobacter gallaeciensis TaxID=60890 RepID=A0AAD0EAY6_9RHOB|nr:M20/M25/M40 family metallo-hydrolase [Phaeobacter gallaeciensis]AHD09124.1 Acetylornithine deacetylase/Succinyl-diaminopimelate desuccinylase [Phaeobacter gallaeciensis DSM 26640]ATE92387.1 putative glutamate carboxypeptidase [Phaeobacter gallaeciensis]ATE97791.1 putative glutamate carboxypeptidase [Phaeobacter gallaeciensis]ATF01052.1 putative glutamate carboxypeptidase [Phaeobacter gallaeciensis]ATF05432.1 putative glutamate carboxypeptidase [Phaeobacter gallaeciensis]
MSLNDVLDRIDTDLDAATQRLMDLLRIQSISTDPAYKEDCDKAADWLVADLRSIGIDAEKRATPGHPMVVGHFGPQDDSLPHVLFYGHYDVQPVDPLELWNTPPFEPQLEETAHGTVIRGRGASDDKGQLMTFVEACRAWQTVNGSLPCRITFFFEGEEESGSPSLVPFMEQHAAELKADLALICDTSMVSRGVPSISSQLRGMLKDEFTLIGPRIDLHSGHYGGPGLNPLRELSRIVASFYDEDTGKVAVDGFYEGVQEVPEDQLRQWEGCGFEEQDYLSNAGYTQAHGEKDRSVLEQQWARPTLEVNGLWGGYNGAGSKTVIPSEAHCKITCRLVGDMDPDALRQKIRKHVEDRLKPDTQVKWDNDLEGSRASVMNISRPEFEAARGALSDEWNREAVFCGMGGSIPIAGFFKSILGMDAMLIGFANEDDAIHSPNEKYDLESFHKGIRSWARVLDALTKT